MRPEHLYYDQIEHWIRGSISAGEEFLFDPDLFRRELKGAWIRYGVPYESLMSFFRNVHVGHIKRTTHRVRASMPRYLEEYKRGRTILELARAANFSPHLFARQLAEHVTAGASLPKKMLGDAMRDPLGVLGPAGVVSESYRDAELVRFEERRTDPAASHVTRLAFEVKEAQDSDPLHGPEKEMKSHLVGVEFEVVLEHQLRLIGIPFETEADLRDRGTARTPDVLLSCPLGIQVSKKDGSGVAWKMIGWIDSKAMFGDVYTHHSSVLPQAEAFVHRFGPGLILYWFGHAPPERLADAHGDIIIAAWELPTKYMLPTGEVLQRNI